MEKPTRARRRKPDTSKADLQPPLSQYPGGQGVHREVESEGHEEKYRVVVEGAIRRRSGRPKVGQGRACTMEAKALLIHPPHQGVCARHGTEELCVTPGELAWFAGGTAKSKPISESEVASDAAPVVGLPSSTSSTVKAV
jgi:hypothetical protein